MGGGGGDTAGTGLTATERFDARDTVFSRAARGELGPDLLEWTRADQQEGGLQALADHIAGVRQPAPAALQHTLFDMAYHLEGRLAGMVAARQVAAAPPSTAARIVKRVLRFLGADLVGITRLDRAFVYSHDAGGRPVACDHRYAIVFAREMDYDWQYPGPDYVTGSATGLGYAQVAFIGALGAAWLRGLGYPAQAHRNRTVLQVPLAVNAGLGELGRMGFLVSARFGPRLRLGSITTDLPLAVDRPVGLGVDEFCRRCLRCAEACPSGAIPRGDKIIVRGVRRWHIDAVKCLRFWQADPERWSHCGRCVAVCPWNQRDTLHHRVAADMVRRLPWLNPALIRLDRLLRPARGRRPEGTGDDGWWRGGSW